MDLLVVAVHADEEGLGRSITPGEAGGPSKGTEKPRLGRMQEQSPFFLYMNY